MLAFPSSQVASQAASRSASRSAAPRRIPAYGPPGPYQPNSTPAFSPNYQGPYGPQGSPTSNVPSGGYYFDGAGPAKDPNPQGLGGIQDLTTKYPANSVPGVPQDTTLRDYLAALLGRQAGQYQTAADDSRLQADAVARITGISQGDLRSNTANQLQQLAEERVRNVEIAYGRTSDQWAAANRDWQQLQSYLGQQTGLASRTRSSATEYFGQQRGLASRALGLANDRAGFSRDTAIQDASSQSTAAGAYLSGAFTRPFDRAQQQYGFDTRGAQQANDSTLSSVSRGERDTAIGYDRTLADIDNARQTSYNQLTTKADETNRQNAYISSLATSYGLRDEDMRNALEQGLRKLGLDSEASIARLTAAADANDAQAAAVASALAQQAVAIAGPSARPSPASAAARTPTAGNAGGNAGRVGGDR